MTGMSHDEVAALLRKVIRQTQVLGVADDLAWAVKGGRVPAVIKRITGVLHINPVLTANDEGKMGLAGFHAGNGANPAKLARSAVRKMKEDVMYRVLISHVDNMAGANETRHHILEQHGRIHSCHITEAGPALGVHFGVGGLIVGFTPQPDPLS